MREIFPSDFNQENTAFVLVRILNTTPNLLQSHLVTLLYEAVSHHAPQCQPAVSWPGTAQGKAIRVNCKFKGFIQK